MEENNTSIEFTDKRPYSQHFEADIQMFGDKTTLTDSHFAFLFEVSHTEQDFWRHKSFCWEALRDRSFQFQCE